MDSKAEVVIGQSGMVDGEIKARRILVSGTFVGTIEAERLEIVATGKVTGEVSVAQLVVESGAHFNGTSHIRGDEPPRQLTHDQPQAVETRGANEAAEITTEDAGDAAPGTAPEEKSDKD